ncbi:MAG: nucleotidyl transferase AbiEii/AbiGii toxin family protein [Phototrophicales bacterium]
MSKDIGQSVFQRLKNLAKAREENHNFLLERYAMERLFYRLGLSSYDKQLVLKGGMRLLAIWRNSHRVTRDADFLGHGISDPESIERIFKEICAIEPEYSDGVVFDTETIKSKAIKEGEPYPGVHIELACQIYTAKLKLQIDIGFGDKVTPEAEIIDFPTLLDAPAPKLYAYPLYTVVAEKFEAMIALGITNSRMKDFFDVWFISQEFDLNGNLLQKAILNTFKWRQTPIPESIPFPLTIEFSTDQNKIIQWNAFCKKNLKTTSVAFETVIEKISDFLMPIIQAIQSNQEFDLDWSAEKQSWNK